MRLLSEEWLAERLRLGSALPVVPGATAVVQHEVHGDAGPARYFDDIREGRLTDSRLGVHPTPHAVIRYQRSVELAMLCGEIDAVSGVISGRITVEGDLNRLLPLVSVLQTPAAIEVLRQLNAVTSD
ncbi:hypothetical protein RVR_9563 [Actinacidiphila reveromycinica]|uniref:SCP2 domain-containing protein n=1 Tax=Actinacidiphila reveromycinica TaxID=659352 RepID=A0A7U3V0B6_9ACTN|nr:hypothetical protein [Streptomyces sp. SN-593]BBB01927.1 hypothetical protein RVR_9563 [Streptomyces sp. SN-593]